MTDSNKPSTGKKPYEKPRLRCLELRADEVLAAGCKTPGGLGPTLSGISCGIGVPGASCRGNGS